MKSEYLDSLTRDQLKILALKLNEAYLNTTTELNDLRATYTRYLYVHPSPRWYTRLWYWIRYREEEV